MASKRPCRAEGRGVRPNPGWFRVGCDPRRDRVVCCYRGGWVCISRAWWTNFSGGYKLVRRRDLCLTVGGRAWTKPLLKLTH